MREGPGHGRQRCLAALVFTIAMPAATPASAASSPDASPYDRVHQQVAWTASGGGQLAFCLLGLEGETGARALAVFRRDGPGWERLFLDRDRSTHPWKLALAEIDGDELPEVLVAVRKVSRFDPVVRNRLFVFDWTEENALFPLWLGSRLGGTLVDFSVVPGSPGADRLAVTEASAAGPTRVRQYSWSGFGFVLAEDGKGE